MKVIFTSIVVGLTLLALTTSNPVQLKEEEDRSFFTCLFCNLVVDTFFQYVEQGRTLEEIVNATAHLCIDVNLYSDKVCFGAVELLMPSIVYIYNHTELIQGNICGMILLGENCKLSDPDKLEWTVNLPTTPKPPVTDPQLPPEGSPTLKVLHISDVHWDPEYLEGSPAFCREPICCRSDSTPTNLSDAKAGYWGSYSSCDIPWITVEKSLQQIGQQHPDIDYILWTGDLVPHDVWSTNQTENIDILTRLVNLFAQHFPNSRVYPTLGNHEAHPVNLFPPPEVTDEGYEISWLYNEASVLWGRWLPADTLTSIRYGGYYTALVRPGLRIISMNMNYCYTFNFWILYKSQDPASSLIWLTYILEEAERMGEKVHIISHIPPGHGDCWTVFNRELNKIINRFESTITALFYGHTHKDEFKIFYDSEELNRPTNLAFIGPSLTTYSDLNPGYRIYTIDGERPGSTYSVLDYTTWIMNLELSNADPNADPVWEKLYDMRSEYGLTDVTPQQVDQLVQRMVTDDDTFQLYFKNHYKNSQIPLTEGCNTTCKAEMICQIVTTNIADQSHCTEVKLHVLGHEEF